MVLDGIGGAASGEVASSLAANKVLEYLKEHYNDTNNLNNLIMAVKYANRCVYEKNKQDKVYKDMGTTISLLYKQKDEAYVVNIGDSRIYLVKKDKMEMITEDDTYVNALLKDKIITEEEAKNHPKKHMLLKALGVTRSIAVETKKIENVSSKCFLFCTDGLTNMLDDNEIFNIIHKNEKNKIVICKKLIDAANKKGGEDNITVIYLDF